MARPDFAIIGAMKCGTSTLHTQLAAQPGVFMSTPKEPNFFSDDTVFAQGMPWYEALFAAAPADALKGEASTHYTKLPTHPHAAARLHAALPDLRLIYMIRDPVERLVSHYIHEWTMGVITAPLDDAVERHPELVAYSRYGMQIGPYVDLYGTDRILVLRLEAMQAEPQAVLDRVGRFLGLDGPLRWDDTQREVNVSAERLRRFPLYDLVVEHPAAAALRRALVPQWVRDGVKNRLRMRSRPTLDAATRARLTRIFDEDAATLARLFPALDAPPSATDAGS